MDISSLGRFTLLEKIGEGGMGRVYKARDTVLERFVAIKLLPEARLGDTERRARFVQEAKAASALNHPNIITVHEIGELDGRTFIVMELIDGKPLSELIPRKGMRLTEALRVAVQASDALAAAHAAGIVHRDLKPANIMVDTLGRVKILDFGLAKLCAPSAISADEPTRTIAVDQPLTDEGTIVGSVPYMSPEQAEGKAIDARSDIFSFGVVVYEMITGQRAFRGESRASVLAAVLSKEPPDMGEIAAATPPEVERLIVRCMRKDVNRRSQSMADVKLALEELREASESGKLARRLPPSNEAAPSWLSRGSVPASLVLGVMILVGLYFFRRVGNPTVPTLVRLSPDDGNNYSGAAISPDGGFVAFASNKSGSWDLWLQQVGGGDPIQLTHGKDASFSSFFPDGKRILYVNTKDTDKNTVETISTLGGQSRVLVDGTYIINHNSMLSPDGSQIAYFEGSRHLLTIVSANGGQPRQLSNWLRVKGASWGRVAWTSDSRYLISYAPFGLQGLEWFAIPVDGGDPLPMGVGDAFRRAGLRLAMPLLTMDDRVIFAGARSDEGPINGWEIRVHPRTLHVQGTPHQLTFGTLAELPRTISRSGTAALDVSKYSADLYMVPLSSMNGQPAGVTRRLTQDGRNKIGLIGGGDPSIVYFGVPQTSNKPGLAFQCYALDLKSDEQRHVAEIPRSGQLAISDDGRHIAYSIPEGDSFSIRVGEPGADADDARLLCKGCGRAMGFSPDGRFVFYQPEARVTPDPARRYTIHMMELDSGKDRPWLTHPTDSLAGRVVRRIGNDGSWVLIWPSSDRLSGVAYIVPWSENPVPASEWIEVKLGTSSAGYSPNGEFFYFFQGETLMARHFDFRARRLGEAFKINLSNSEFDPGPSDSWSIRSAGLAFIHTENIGSIWLMDLPR
jgi:serine/threonine protein kinase